MSRFTICYDIAHGGQRAKVARILGEYGRRLQYSVFEAWLEPEELPELAGASGRCCADRPLRHHPDRHAPPRPADLLAAQPEGRRHHLRGPFPEAAQIHAAAANHWMEGPRAPPEDPGLRPVRGPACGGTPHGCALPPGAFWCSTAPDRQTSAGAGRQDRQEARPGTHGVRPFVGEGDFMPSVCYNLSLSLRRNSLQSKVVWAIFATRRRNRKSAKRCP